MRTGFNRSKELTVGFCERCGQVCDEGRAAPGGRVLLQQRWVGVRI